MLGGFDEYFLGYKDRSPVADVEHHAKLLTVNGIFFPIILQDGRAIGNWKRSFKKNLVEFSYELLPGSALDRGSFEKECFRYADFQ